MTSSARGALVIAGLLWAGAPARAEPAADLAGCPTFDRAALSRAISTELGPDRADGRVVVVTCPDAVTAHLRVAPAPAAGPLARSLDLGDVPGDLRVRLIALAVAELLAAASLVEEAASPPGPPAGVDPRPRRPGGDVRDPTAMRDVDPTVAASPRRPAAGSTPGLQAAVPPGRAEVLAASTPPRSTLLARRAEPERVGFAPRAGVRVFWATPVPLLDLGVELVRGPWSVGAAVALGQADDVLGQASLRVGAVTAGATLACTGGRTLHACLGPRLSVGVAAVSATPAPALGMLVAGASASHAYAELAGQLALGRQAGPITLLLAGELGWAEGLIATAEDRDLAHLAGLVGTVSAGARWR